MRLFVFKLIFLLILICSCQTVNTFYYYDEDIDFSAYSSFNFYLPESGLAEKDTNRILEAIELKLESKGMESMMDAASSVDFFINFYDEFTGELVQVNPDYLQAHELTPTDYYIELTVDITDAQTDELIWQGIAEKLISHGLILTEENRKFIFQKLIKKLMQSYPPQNESI